MFFTNLKKLFLFLAVFLLCCSAWSSEEGVFQSKYGRVNFSLTQCSKREQEFFRETLQKVSDFRDKLRSVKSGSMAKDSSLANAQRVGLNIACFSFDFFTQNGQSLLKKPIFFGSPLIEKMEEKDRQCQSLFGGEFYKSAHINLLEEHRQKLVESLHYPHFFASGRLSKEKVEKTLGEEEVDLLTFLPETPTQEFLKLMQYSESLQSLDKVKAYIPELDCKLFDILRKREKDFERYFFEQLSSLEKEWLKSIKNRSDNLDANSPDFILSSNYTKVIKAKFKRGLIINDQSKNCQDEKYLLHSEQLALTRLKNELETFLKWVLEVFKPEEISECRMYISTYNTICARCAISTLIDSCKEAGIEEKITNILGGSQEKNMPLFSIYVAASEKCKTEWREGEVRPLSDQEDYWDMEYSESVEQQESLIKQILISRGNVSLRQRQDDEVEVRDFLENVEEVIPKPEIKNINPHAEEDIPDSTKQESIKLAMKQGNIGSREISGWELQDVEDRGNCFYDAVIHQMKIINHPFLDGIPTETSQRDSLRLRIQNETFKDEEWAEDRQIDKLVKELDVILAVVDTRIPENGFVAYSRSESGEVITHFPGEDIPLPDRPIIRIATTGNHFLSVVNNPVLLRGCLLGSFHVPQ